MKKFLTFLVCLSVIVFSVQAQVTQDLEMKIPEGIDPDNELLKLGYLDVTLYGADHTGTHISTDQINEAIRAARDCQLTCYFPSGTYLVDDTITGMMETRKLWADATVEYSDIRYPVTLVGERNPRPVIKLTGPGNGYNNPNSPKPLIWMWSKNGRTLSTDPMDEQSNIFYNATLKNFVIDVRGYAGAEGVRFSGAQGSTIEDVTVLADGAFAGFHGAVGQGGGSYNIEVIGGDHAFVYDNGTQQKYAMIAGASFIDQKKEVFRIDRMGLPVTIVGFYIEKSDGNIFSGSPIKGGISLIDGVINYENFTSNNNLFPSLNSNLYIKNTYVKNADKIVYTSDLDHAGWDLIEEYYACNNSKGQNLINGSNHTNNELTLNSDITAGQVPTQLELQQKHTWDNDTFISIEDRDKANFVNVKDPVKMSNNSGPGAASGDAVTDDTEKLQWAIDHFEMVFIPRGRFVINKPLILGANTQLFGSGKVFSIIRAGKNWDYAFGKSMLKTVEDANGTATVSFVMFETDYRDQKDLTRLEWHLGENSLVKDISVGVEVRTGQQSFYEYHNMFEISGSTAGGRFYGLHGENTFISGITAHPDYRHILISGTRQPMKIYGCNAERAFSEGQMKIVNSKNIDVYYLKSEAGYGGIGGTAMEANVALTVRDSENVHLYAYSGVTELHNGMGAVEFYDCENVSAANMVKANTSGSDAGWNYVKEVYNGTTYNIPAYKQVALFKRENAQSVAEEKVKEGEFSVYPHQGEGLFTLRNETMMPISNVQIRDLSGRLLFNKSFSDSQVQIDIRNWSDGIYLLGVGDEITKIVKSMQN
jgi:hypothetical protein